MTKEEAITILKDLWRYEHTEYTDNEVRIALDMAIDVLEQEPCEDCVSRQFIYEIGATCIATRNENGKLIALGAIEELPSVKLKEPKTDVLDKIRAEIEQAFCKVENDYDYGRNYGLYMATQIIDKYRKGV